LPEIPSQYPKGKAIKFMDLSPGDRLWINGIPYKKLYGALAVEVWTGALLAVKPEDKVTT